ncbi:MAG: 4-hydroxy-tetrahydrodipicolinate reductase [Deltaproteobacteria bacterium]|nr:4-hydroxy-tetrahydrodipicolinate reductase [Deltaproteobacteria bacterium]
MKQPIKAAISGVTGRMGTQLLQALKEEKGLIELAVGISSGLEASVFVTPEQLSNAPAFDVLIDFSVPEVTLDVLEYCSRQRIPAVVGTTGFSPQEKERLRGLSKQMPTVFSANMSLGVNLLFALLREAADRLSDWDLAIVETHHKAKRDAISGTALALKECVLSTHPSASVAAIRGGDCVGEHEVVFSGFGEKLILAHRATDRMIFARGALRAAKWLIETRPAPGCYSMLDVLKVKRDQ